MPLRLQNAYGYAKATDNLHQMVAAQEAARLAEEARIYKHQQDALKYGLDSRGVAVDEGNLGERIKEGEFSRRPVRPTPIQLRGMVGPDGKRVTQFRDPSDLSVTGEFEEFNEPNAAGAGPDFRFREYLSGPYSKEIGKPLEQMTAAEVEAARKRFLQSDDRPFQPFILQGPTGPIAVDRTTATSRPVTDQGGTPVGPTPSAGMRDDIARSDANLDLIDDITGVYKKEYVGPVQGRFDSLRQRLPDMPGSFDDLDPNKQAFRAKVASLKNYTINLITGAHVGVDEEKRIMDELPDVNQRPEVFEANLAATRRNREYLRSRLAAGGNAQPRQPSSVSPAAKPYDGEVRPARDGRLMGRTADGRIVEVVKSPTGGYAIK